MIVDDAIVVPVIVTSWLSKGRVGWADATVACVVTDARKPMFSVKRIFARQPSGSMTVSITVTQLRTAGSLVDPLSMKTPSPVTRDGAACDPRKECSWKRGVRLNSMRWDKSLRFICRIVSPSTIIRTTFCVVCCWLWRIAAPRSFPTDSNSGVNEPDSLATFLNDHRKALKKKTIFSGFLFPVHSARFLFLDSCF